MSHKQVDSIWLLNHRRGETCKSLSRPGHRLSRTHTHFPHDAFLNLMIRCRIKYSIVGSFIENFMFLSEISEMKSSSLILLDLHHISMLYSIYFILEVLVVSFKKHLCQYYILMFSSRTSANDLRFQRK